MDINWKHYISGRKKIRRKLPDEVRNYRAPAWKLFDWGFTLLESLILFSAFLYCFYRNRLFFLLYPAFAAFYIKNRRKQALQKRKELLRRQFRDAMYALSSSLQVGYALENAIGEVAREMGGLWGKDSDIYLELEEIAHTIGINQPVELLFYEFARRSGVGEILLFAEILRYSNRSGGNLIRITKDTAVQLGDKIRIQQQIQASQSSNRMQQKIMCAAPILIILYLQWSAPDLLEGLYGNLTGTVLMTCCLMVYLLSVWMMIKIWKSSV